MGIETQWPLVQFSLFMGLAGGMMVISGIAQLSGKSDSKTHFMADLIELIVLVVGGCFSLLHLASPENVMAAATNIFSFSGISIELLLLGACCIIVIVDAVILKREASATALKVLGVLGIVFGVLLAFFTGHGYEMAARPLWDTVFLPLAYLGSGMALGSFSYGVVQLICGDALDDIVAVKIAYLVLGLVGAVTTAAYAFALGMDVASAEPVLFWGGLILLGVIGVAVCSIVMYAALKEANMRAVIVIGFVVALIGALSVRMIMWSAGIPYMDLFGLSIAGGVTF